MNREINYEAEVKKVYPDAFISFDNELKAGNVYRGYFRTPFGLMPKCICHLLSESDNEIAWQLAYEKINAKPN